MITKRPSRNKSHQFYCHCHKLEAKYTELFQNLVGWPLFSSTPRMRWGIEYTKAAHSFGVISVHQTRQMFCWNLLRLQDFIFVTFVFITLKRFLIGLRSLLYPIRENLNSALSINSVKFKNLNLCNSFCKLSLKFY